MSYIETEIRQIIGNTLADIALTGYDENKKEQVKQQIPAKYNPARNEPNSSLSNPVCDEAHESEIVKLTDKYYNPDIIKRYIVNPWATSVEDYNKLFEKMSGVFNCSSITLHEYIDNFVQRDSVVKSVVNQLGDLSSVDCSNIKDLITPEMVYYACRDVYGTRDNFIESEYDLFYLLIKFNVMADSFHSIESLDNFLINFSDHIDALYKLSELCISTLFKAEADTIFGPED